MPHGDSDQVSARGDGMTRVGFICLAFLGACRPAPGLPPPLTHDAYVWQRLWTPAVTEALRAATPWVRAWRVLGAEVGRAGSVTLVDVDRETLVGTGKPVVLVVRITGQLADWDPGDVARRSLALLADWQRTGLPVVALEVDHDCATKRLPAYAAFLARLRLMTDAVPVRLAVTALPTWLKSPALLDVLASVDEAVLQVHSVSNPRGGLFDHEQARTWVAALARTSPVAFRVALPTYGSRVSWDVGGRVVAVESEFPLGLEGARTLELGAKPQAVASLLETWRDRSPLGLLGVAWFRLPTSDDRRAWSLGTWRAVIEGRELDGRVGAEAIAADTPGLFDVFVVNGGDLDAQLPQEVTVASRDGCRAADGLRYYRVAPIGGVPRFLLVSPDVLRAHRRRMIGWVRCPGSEVEVRARP